MPEKSILDYTLREIIALCKQGCEGCPFLDKCEMMFNVGPCYWGDDLNGNE